MRFLSQEWLDRQKALYGTLPERRGATARVQLVVTGTPDGEVRLLQSFVDGALHEVSFANDQPVEVTFVQTYADAQQVARGDLAAEVAFMQGRLKVTGDMGTVMGLLPVLRSEEYRAALRELSSQTDY